MRFSNNFKLMASVMMIGGMTLAVVSPASADSFGPFGHAYNCTGGIIAPGNYRSMVVTGVCYMPAGNITVNGNLTVAPGALLDNGSPGDPSASTPAVSAVLTVNGNVFVGAGGVLLLGCTPNGACGGPPGISTALIRGNLTAIDALGVIVQSGNVSGNFTLLGGGGGTMGGVNTGACFAATPPAPWSEDTGSAVLGQPVYSDVEDSSIGGNFTILGLSSCWLGSLRNQIHGSATFIGNQFGDPDAMEIGNNVIDGNLTCLANAPAPQFGDGANPDVVGGAAFGQCGRNVVLPDPAPGAGFGTGISRHFAVSKWGLSTYYGTLSVSAVGPPLEDIPTVSGDSIVAQLFDATFASGSGLTGSATYTGGPPGQGPGDAVLSTVYPDGSQSFTAFLNCGTCSFASQTGPVSLHMYGTTTRNGFTSGTFIITSGGVVPPAPGLATLVGYGSFYGSGSSLSLVEHLGFG